MTIQISSRGLSGLPKNSLPNLAGVETCDEFIRKELTEAGIEISELPVLLGTGEVPYKVIGSISIGPTFWGFNRAWRYWVAEGPGIPLKDAMELHKTYGKEVRVNGHCGCPSPEEQNGNFGTGFYHIDTQQGLNVLAAMIRKVAARDD